MNNELQDDEFIIDSVSNNAIDDSSNQVSENKQWCILNLICSVVPLALEILLFTGCFTIAGECDNDVSAMVFGTIFYFYS